MDVAEVGAEVGEGVGGCGRFGIVGRGEGVEQEGCEELGVGVGEEGEGESCVWACGAGGADWFCRLVLVCCCETWWKVARDYF